MTRSLVSVYRRHVGDVFVTAARAEDGQWSVTVTDVASQPVDEATWEAAIGVVLEEVSSLRAHLWRYEMGHATDD